MLRWIVGVSIAGCAGVVGVGRPPDGAAAPSCPEGTIAAEGPAGAAGPDAPGASVRWCRAPDGAPEGPYVERWPDGGLAVEGTWAGGARDGVWTAWEPGGAFRSRITWDQGVQRGERLEVADDGRLIAFEMVDGAAHALRTLPADTAVPEWSDGKRTDGARYGHRRPAEVGGEAPPAGAPE